MFCPLCVNDAPDDETLNPEICEASDKRELNCLSNAVDDMAAAIIVSHNRNGRALTMRVELHRNRAKTVIGWSKPMTRSSILGCS